MHDLPELYLYIKLTHRLERGFKLFVSHTHQSTKENRKHPHSKMKSVEKCDHWIKHTQNLLLKLCMCVLPVHVHFTAHTDNRACKGRETVCRDVLELKWCWTVWMWEPCTETSMKKCVSRVEHTHQQTSQSHPRPKDGKQARPIFLF